jgi:hypothetical protein
LPNGCGYPSLILCRDYNILDAAHNLRIFVEGTEAEMLAAWALLLLTRQLTMPKGRIMQLSEADHERLAQDVFDLALAYRLSPWLTHSLNDTLTAKEVVYL